MCCRNCVYNYFVNQHKHDINHYKHTICLITSFVVFVVQLAADRDAFWMEEHCLLHPSLARCNGASIQKLITLRDGKRKQNDYEYSPHQLTN